MKLWVAVATVLVGLTGCQTGPTPGLGPGLSDGGYTVEGGDAKLSLARGALPANVGLADVSVARLSPAALAAVGLDDSWQVYRLEPDGTRLSQPATLEIPLVGDAIGPVYHVHGATRGELSYLDIRATLDPVEGNTLAVELDSFSFIAVRSGGGPGVSAIVDLPDGSREYAIGKVVPWSLLILFNPATYFGPVPVPGLAPGTTVTAEGSVSTVAATISPAGPVEGRPTRATATVQEGAFDDVRPLALEAVHDFTCVSAGIARIRADIMIQATGRQLERLDPLVEAAAKLSGRFTDGYTVAERPFTMDLDVYSTAAECVAAGAPADYTLIDPDGLKCPGAEDPTISESGQVQGKKLQVHKLKDGQCYPVHQFQPSGEDLCKEVHYHVRLTSLAGTVRNDSQPCGAAKDSDIAATGEIWVTDGQYGRVGP